MRKVSDGTKEGCVPPTSQNRRAGPAKPCPCCFPWEGWRGRGIEEWRDLEAERWRHGSTYGWSKLSVPSVPTCSSHQWDHGQQLPAEAASLKQFKFLVTHSVETEGRWPCCWWALIKGSYWTLTWQGHCFQCPQDSLVKQWKHRSFGFLTPFFFFFPTRSLFYYDHIPLQLHISILSLSKSSSLISCTHCSLLPLFPRVACHHNSETGANVWIPVWNHHSPLQHSPSRTQPEGQIPPCSLCSVAELSCCHGLFHTDTASFSSTWQQKHLPSSVDLGNHSVNGASEIFWDVDISGISICSDCCFFPYGSGDLTATYPFMCKTLPIAWYKDLQRVWLVTEKS